MRRNLEIPQGKRTKLYRFLEILPGAISYGAIILLFILSWVSPVLGAIYLFVFIVSTLVKAVGVAYRTIQGYEVIRRAEKVDWRSRLVDLENPRASFERLRSDDSKSYHFKEHVENLKHMSTMSDEYPNPAKTMHESEASVQNTLRLLNLPEDVKKIMVKEKLTEGVMRPLVSRDEKTIRKILPKIVEEEWTARKVERYFAETTKKSSARAIKRSAYVKDENALSAKYNSVAVIKGRSLTFKCKKEADLQALVKMLLK